MDYIESMKKNIELIKSENLEEIEKIFEPTTECENCHFCMKPNPEYKNIVSLPKCCILYQRKLDDNVNGCYGGYKLKENK